VYNIVQYLGELGASVMVLRNDVADPDEVKQLSPNGVLVSPGPGHPRDAGNSLAVIDYCVKNSLPMFGVCLGHQALGELFGATVNAAPELLHGRSSLVEHDGQGLFAGVTNPLIAGRYHSLVVDSVGLPDDLKISATSNGLIMGLRHRTLPLEGVQFHPESVLTQDGYKILANWLSVCGSPDAVVRARALTTRSDAVRASLPQPIH
jgi:para-aminobenzoate synthetase component 2